MNRRVLRWCFVGLLFWSLLACQTADIPALQSRILPIINGKKDLRYPAIGALSIDKKGKFCTATLIAQRVVLSAGHCIETAQGGLRNKQKVYFRVDWPDANSFRSEYHEIALAQHHPRYKTTQTGIYDDVGVLILKKAVVKPAPLSLNFTALNNSWIGRKILFLGYGLIKTQPQRQGTNHKMSATISMHQLLHDRFATLENGVSICSGDSGGPALYLFGKTLRVIGVNSYVQGSNDGSGPLCNGAGVSFRTDIYFSWLDPLLKKYGFVCKSDADCGVCHECKQGSCAPRSLSQTSAFCQPCKSDADCGDKGNFCVRTPQGRRCLQACFSDKCCPSGTSCQVVDGKRQCAPTGGVCPAVSCKTKAECGPGESCQSGECKPVVVQPSSMLCKPCVNNGQCGPNALCWSYTSGATCTMPCASDLFCPAGYSCKALAGRTQRQCLPSSDVCPCQKDTDCHAKYKCEKGVCKLPGGGKFNQPCDQKTQSCAEGYTCLKLNGAPQLRCVQVCRVTSPYPAGSPASNCRKGDFCDNGSRCTRVQLRSGTESICLKTCSSTADCSEGGSCARAGAGSPPLCVCFSDNDCKPGYGCNTTKFGNFGFCAKKWAVSPNEKPCPRLHACQEVGPGLKFCNPIPCTRHEQCDAGEMCRGGLCISRPEPASEPKTELTPEPTPEPASEPLKEPTVEWEREPKPVDAGDFGDSSADRTMRDNSPAPGACQCQSDKTPLSFQVWWILFLAGMFWRRRAKKC